MSHSISIHQARRIALAAQGFSAPRPKGRVDRRHLRKTMGRLQLLQLDSVPVVVRTQYMPFFSRLGAYRADMLDEIAYDADEWFEAWSHEASLLPVEMEPWLRWSKQGAREGNTWRHLYSLAQKDPGYIEAVLGEVKARGPIAARDLEDPRRRSGNWWGSRSGGAVALDWLYRIGALGVRRTRNFVKQFDLLERIVPAEIRARETPTLESSLDELLMRSASAHGIASADCLVDYFRLPVRPAKARLELLVEDGRLEKAGVEGWKKPAYRHPEAKLPREIKAVTLLSPFDPVVWNRKRIKALFGFDYRIEIYTPVKKRKYGYYVLPFLMGERLVGRFDLKTDREARVLRVLAAHAEFDVDFGEVATAAARELVTLASFLGVDRVQVGRRGNLAKALRTESLALG
ncbi:MAG: crosslink repair DNA glycosylase YcaQ family protein [Myxococcales bacterium]|nr:winged helix-turn-helix domain-containing protein [Myxococcales bacterium]HIK85963.1 winged helix-turn-helix domain-containing protein [Myxococcales bacterium]